MASDFFFHFFISHNINFYLQFKKKIEVLEIVIAFVSIRFALPFLEKRSCVDCGSVNCSSRGSRSSGSIFTDK